MKQLYENRNLIIQKLIDNNKSGYRFHNLFDKIASSLIIILLFLQFVLIFIVPQITLNWYYFIPLLVIFPIAYGIGICGLYKDSKNNITIQRDPPNELIEKIILEISNSKTK